MKVEPLGSHELGLMRGIFCRHAEIVSVTLFGSRAKGTHTERSDVDLAVSGDIDTLQAEAIAAELDELPLPLRFEVQAMDHIHHRALLDHIKRVGITLYSKS